MAETDKRVAIRILRPDQAPENLLLTGENQGGTHQAQAAEQFVLVGPGAPAVVMTQEGADLVFSMDGQVLQVIEGFFAIPGNDLGDITVFTDPSDPAAATYVPPAGEAGGVESLVPSETLVDAGPYGPPQGLEGSVNYWGADGDINNLPFSFELISTLPGLSDENFPIAAGGDSVVIIPPVIGPPPPAPPGVTPPPGFTPAPPATPGTPNNPPYFSFVEGEYRGIYQDRYGEVFPDADWAATPEAYPPEGVDLYMYEQVGNIPDNNYPEGGGDQGYQVADGDTSPWQFYGGDLDFTPDPVLWYPLPMQWMEIGGGSDTAPTDNGYLTPIEPRFPVGVHDPDGNGLTVFWDNGSSTSDGNTFGSNAGLDGLQHFYFASTEFENVWVVVSVNHDGLAEGLDWGDASFGPFAPYWNGYNPGQVGYYDYEGQAFQDYATGSLLLDIDVLTPAGLTDAERDAAHTFELTGVVSDGVDQGSSPFRVHILDVNEAPIFVQVDSSTGEIITEGGHPFEQVGAYQFNSQAGEDGYWTPFETDYSGGFELHGFEGGIEVNLPAGQAPARGESPTEGETPVLWYQIGDVAAVDPDWAFYDDSLTYHFTQDPSTGGWGYDGLYSQFRPLEYGQESYANTLPAGDAYFYIDPVSGEIWATEAFQTAVSELIPRGEYTFSEWLYVHDNVDVSEFAISRSPYSDYPTDGSNVHDDLFDVVGVDFNVYVPNHDPVFTAGEAPLDLAGDSLFVFNLNESQEGHQHQVAEIFADYAWTMDGDGLFQVPIPGDLLDGFTQIAATDLDGDALQFSFSQGGSLNSSDGLFTIIDDGSVPGDGDTTAILQASSELSFEDVAYLKGHMPGEVSQTLSLDYDLTVTDGYGGSDSATITINLNDVNEGPAFLSAAFSDPTPADGFISPDDVDTIIDSLHTTTYEFDLGQTSFAGGDLGLSQTVGQLFAIDPDIYAGQTLTFAWQPAATSGDGYTNDGMFSIDPVTGEITLQVGAGQSIGAQDLLNYDPLTGEGWSAWGVQVSDDGAGTVGHGALTETGEARFAMQDQGADLTINGGVFWENPELFAEGGRNALADFDLTFDGSLWTSGSFKFELSDGYGDNDGFVIDPLTGELYGKAHPLFDVDGTMLSGEDLSLMIAELDFEYTNPETRFQGADGQWYGVYDIEVVVTNLDTGSTYTQTFPIFVGDVYEAPVFDMETATFGLQEQPYADSFELVTQHYDGSGGYDYDVVVIDDLFGAQATISGWLNALGGSFVQPRSVTVNPDGGLGVAEPESFGLPSLNGEVDSFDNGLGTYESMVVDFDHAVDITGTGLVNLFNEGHLEGGTVQLYLGGALVGNVGFEAPAGNTPDGEGYLKVILNDGSTTDLVSVDQIRYLSLGGEQLAENEFSPFSLEGLVGGVHGFKIVGEAEGGLAGWDVDWGYLHNVAWATSDHASSEEFNHAPFVDGEGPRIASDIIISAPWAAGGELGEPEYHVTGDYGTDDDHGALGRVYVVFGEQSTHELGSNGDVDLGLLGDNSVHGGYDGYTIVGEFNAGWSVAGIGDMNGDGYGEVMIGAPALGEGFGDNGLGLESNEGEPVPGSVYIVSGNQASGAEVDLTDPTGLGSDFVEIRGVSGIEGHVAANFGGAVAALDLDGDDLLDLIISAPLADNGKGDEGAGQAFVLFGDQGASGSLFEAIAAHGGTIDISGLSGNLGLEGADYAGFTIDGPSDGLTGYSVSRAGDVNGDGIDDLIVGMPGASPETAQGDHIDGAGVAAVIFGGQGQAYWDGVLGGDDTFSLMDLSGNAGQFGFSVWGAEQDSHAGWAVSNAGDFNGDGIDDLMVSQLDDGSGDFAGDAYVIYGGQDFGAVGGGDAATQGAIDLAKVGLYSDAAGETLVDGGVHGLKIAGLESYDLAGHSLDVAGDINGDGYDDLIVGIPGADQDYDASAYQPVVGEDPPDSTPASDAPGEGEASESGIEEVFDESLPDNGQAAVLMGQDADDWGLTETDDGWQRVVDLEPSAPSLDNLPDNGALNGNDGFILQTVDEALEEQYGYDGDTTGLEVSGVGDVNGDGYDDLAVSSPTADGVLGEDGETVELPDSGETHILYGGQHGLSTTEDPGDEALPEYDDLLTASGEEVGDAVVEADGGDTTPPDPVDSDPVVDVVEAPAPDPDPPANDVPAEVVEASATPTDGATT